ncbi:MAG: MmgE/PrpD family protein [Pseudomonadota bacterium]
MPNSNSKFFQQFLTWLRENAPLELSNGNREFIKLLFLDWLGCVIEGSQQKLPQTLLRESFPPSSQGFTNLSAIDQARVLGTSAHVLEKDDSEFIGETHPSAVIFSAILPLCSEEWPLERIINAAAFGFSGLLPLGYAMNPTHYRNGWHGTGTVGTIAAALAAHRILDRSEQTLAGLLTLASTQMAGIQGIYGTVYKALNAGNAASSGVLAAQLCELSTTEKDTFSGYGGVFDLFGANNQANNFFSDIPRSDFSWIKVKEFPSCHCTHAGIYASLKKQKSINAQEIDGIKIRGSAYAVNMTSISKPKTRDQAFFSLTYCCALALLREQITVQDFQFINRDCYSMEEKMNLVIDPHLEDMEIKIDINYLDGHKEELSHTVNRGFGQQCLTFVEDKFLNQASKVLSESKIHETIEQVLVKNTPIRYFYKLLDEVFKSKTRAASGI